MSTFQIVSLLFQLAMSQPVYLNQASAQPQAQASDFQAETNSTAEQGHLTYTPAYINPTPWDSQIMWIHERLN